MLQFLFDTDHLTLFQHGHPTLGSRLALLPPDAVGISAITVEESLRGRLAQLSRARSGPDRILRYALLIETVQVFQQLPLLPFDQAAETRYQQLLNVHSRVGRQSEDRCRGVGQQLGSAYPESSRLWTNSRPEPG